MQAHYIMSTFERQLWWTDKSRDDEVITWCLAIDEHIAYRWKKNIVKSWNKSKEYENLHKVENLNLG